MKKILIIGGGIAGLIAGIRLARHDYKVNIIEKHTYPRHKVCGEYISKEVINFLIRESLLPEEKYLPEINQLQITSFEGKSASIPLASGGIGISRYYYEDFLFRCAEESGVIFHFDEAVSIDESKTIRITTRTNSILEGDVIIGAYGKRDKLDRKLDRQFFRNHSPYAGVKYHAILPGLPDNLITLHNFPGGYCGICKVEDDITNICYLVHRDKIREAGNLDQLEEKVLFKNPVLKEALEQADRNFPRPLVINEVSFETKAPVEKNIPMIGDAAGMITPLCGNGMAMAVHTAKLLSDLIITNPSYSVDQLCKDYSVEWLRLFQTRLTWGRFMQRYLFGRSWASSLAVMTSKNAPLLAKYLIEKTHGKAI